MLGLRPGDAKIIRNAGARVTDDALRSLVLAVNLLGVNRVCVVQHTDCADGRRRPTTRCGPRSREASGADAAGWDFLAFTDQDATLHADLERIRACPLLPGDLAVAGFVFDVRTGELVPA